MDPSPRSAPQDDVSAAEAAFGRRGCCCFWIPWRGGRSSYAPSAEWWERIRAGERGEDPTHEGGGWWRKGLRALMKAREWSEIVAGPRWKNFIRRFNRNPRHGGGGGGGGMVRFGSRFQYDPLSYALNFDDGEVSPERDGGYPDFSARFVAPPASAKSPMDVGGRDAPPVFAPPLAAAH